VLNSNIYAIPRKRDGNPRVEKQSRWTQQRHETKKRLRPMIPNCHKTPYVQKDRMNTPGKHPTSESKDAIAFFADGFL
jgi:hypothetical protein